MCHGALYKLQIVPESHSNPQTLLWVAGEDCGILAYDWNQLLENHLSPIAHYEPYPSPLYVSTVRDFCVDDNTQTAAVDDDWGLYQWNIETGARIVTPFR